MDFHTLPRRDLQTLCKRNKILANMTNAAMVDALQALPMVEGLDAIIHEAQQYQSPKRAAAGTPEPPSRSCRRTSTRRQPNPQGSSLPRTRRAATGRAGKNEAAVEKEDGGEENNAGLVPAAGIPNSPTTLSARGWRTRTLITAGGLGEEEEEAGTEKKKEEEGKIEPLPLEIPKTPATRATRGRRAATQIAKPSAERVEATKKEEGGAPAVPHTPSASTARRASTRRGTRAAPEEASARSTRYRTRRTAMEEAAETETAGPINNTTTCRKNGMRRAKAADSGVLAEDVPVAGEGAVGPAEPLEEEVVEIDPGVLAGGAAAESEQPGADSTADICLAVSEVEVDQTVEDSPADDSVLVEGERSHGDGDDHTVGEGESGKIKLVDSTVDEDVVPSTGSVDPTVEVEEVTEMNSDDPTVEECSHPVAMAAAAAVHQTVEDSPASHPSDLQGGVENAAVAGMAGAFEGRGGQVAAEEKPLEIGEISPGPSEDDEVEITVADLDDQTVQEDSDLVDFRSEEEVLVPVVISGHVDPTAQEIEVPVLDSDAETIDPTVEDGEMTASEAEALEDVVVPTVAVLSVEASPEIGDTEVAIAAPSVTVPPAVVETLLRQTKEEDESSGLVEKKSTPMEEEEGRMEDEEAEEEKAPGLVVVVSMEEEEEEGPPPAEADLAEQAQQPPGNDDDGDIFSFGPHQDKENAAVEACLGPAVSGGGGLTATAVMEYDNTTSMRKLRAALKETLQAMEEEKKKKKKRAALATLDDNCVMSAPTAPASNGDHIYIEGGGGLRGPDHHY